MTPKERLYARLKGEPVDKIPNLNIAMALVAKCAGVDYEAYVKDHRHLVRGNILCAQRFGFDAVSVISDPMREASAFGASLQYAPNGPPFSRPPLLADGYDPQKLTIVPPQESPRTLDRIQGVEQLRLEVGEEYPVIGWVEGVLAEAADLRGVNDLMMDLALEEPWLQELMDTIFRQQCCFAKAQIEAGADIIGVGNAVASLVGPGLYEAYALRYDRELVGYIHAHGAKAKLHICGNIKPLLKLLTQVEADILDVDWMVDFGEAIAAFASTPTAICGNVDPVSVLLQGTPADVERAVKACLRKAGKNTLLAAGCEVPASTPEENLLVMDRLLYL